MSVDSKTCQCVPIKDQFGNLLNPPQTSLISYEPETPNFTCNKDGNKICDWDTFQCPKGERYDDDACMCFPLAKCRRFCPQGQGLDPREFCDCID